MGNNLNYLTKTFIPLASACFTSAASVKSSSQEFGELVEDAADGETRGCLSKKPFPSLIRKLQNPNANNIAEKKPISSVSLVRVSPKKLQPSRSIDFIFDEIEFDGEDAAPPKVVALELNKEPLAEESASASAASTASGSPFGPAKFSIELRKNDPSEVYGVVNDLEFRGFNSTRCLRITCIRQHGILYVANRRLPVESRICVGAQILRINGKTDQSEMREELHSPSVFLEGLLPPTEYVTIQKCDKQEHIGLRLISCDEDPNILRILGVGRRTHSYLQGRTILSVNGVVGPSDVLEEELRSSKSMEFILLVRFEHVPIVPVSKLNSCDSESIRSQVQ